MKRHFFQLLVLTTSLFVINASSAQTTAAAKIGFFDIDMMTQALPGYHDVDSMVALYESKDLAAEYQLYMNEYSRIDSTYKADSAAKKSQAALDILKNQKAQVANNLIYWQQISQNKSQQKRQEFAAPLYKEVVTAYKKVLATNNYSIVLKPSAIELFGSTKVENIFEKVSKELKIPLPEGLKVQR